MPKGQWFFIELREWLIPQYWGFWREKKPEHKTWNDLAKAVLETWKTYSDPISFFARQLSTVSPEFVLET